MKKINLQSPPNSAVTQALMALLVEKGAKLRPNYNKSEVEKKGRFPRVWAVFGLT